MIPRWLCLLALLVPFLLSAWLLPVWLDCDESLNYAEPLHYLLFGWGLQPWEWSPAYALRPYSYLLPFWALLAPLRGLVGEKWVLLRLARSAVALFSAWCVSSFIQAVDTHLRPWLLLAWLCAPGSGISLKLDRCILSNARQSLTQYLFCQFEYAGMVLLATTA